ncbi:MAG: hypothetical protein Q9163_006228 [Psora crenata]
MPALKFALDEADHIETRQESSLRGLCAHLPARSEVSSEILSGDITVIGLNSDGVCQLWRGKDD